MCTGLMDMCFSDLLETTNGACGLTKFAIDGFRVVTIFTDTAPIDFKKTGDVIVLDTQGDTMV